MRSLPVLLHTALTVSNCEIAPFIQVDVRLEVEHVYIFYINMYYITCRMLGRMLQMTSVNSLRYACHSVNKFLKRSWKFLFRDHRAGRLMISIIPSHVCLDCLYVPYLPNVSTDNRNTGVDRVDEQVTWTKYSVSYKLRKAALEVPIIWAVHHLAGRTRSHIPYHLNFQKNVRRICPIYFSEFIVFEKEVRFDFCCRTDGAPYPKK